MFELKFLGHASWLIKNNDFKILCDPWFNPEGAYFSQWHQFPRNDHLFNELNLNDLDFVYISHAHEDHFDEWTLDHLERHVPIYIPKFKDRFLFQQLKKMGFKDIKELDDESVVVKNIDIKIIKEEGHLDNDSCLILDDGNKKILNLNDCHIDFSEIKKHADEVDLLLLQASSAIWWPCVYHYNKDDMISYGTSKRRNALKRALEYAKYLNAKMVIPNAGPPFFYDDNLDIWNLTRKEEWNPFVLMDEAVEYLNNHDVQSSLVVPGSNIILKPEKTHFSHNEEDLKIYENLDQYMRDYKQFLNSKKILKPQATEQELSELIGKFSDQLKVIKKISKFYVKKIDFPVFFNFKSLGKWIMDFSDDRCLIPFDQQEYKYGFILDPHTVCHLFRERQIDFERYFLGCNFKCKRSPDVYNEYLFALLKYFDTKRFLTSEKIYSERENLLDQTFVLKHNDKSFEVQKYCPHMLADLEEIGFVDDDANFVCPLHGWKFDLSTGKCDKNGHCLKIRSIND